MNYYSCHQATEICSGLILGGIRDIDDMLRLGADILVPLDFLRGSIWYKGFRGKIIYCPIEDGGILPDDILDALLNRIYSYLRDGKRVAIFCAGGHGRTGYVAACLLAKIGLMDPHPIAYLHEHYCRHAVETEVQREAIRTYIEKVSEQKQREREERIGKDRIVFPDSGSENGSLCSHEWEEVRVCPEDCDIPLAGGVEDLTGGFCYGNDPNMCNYSGTEWRCKKCGQIKK